jgi:hypothetical protein
LIFSIDESLCSVSYLRNNIEYIPSPLTPEHFIDVSARIDSVLGMIRPNFLSADDRLELERCVRRHCEDHGIARRANAILLLDRGKSCAQIAAFLYLDDDTIRGRHKAFIERG